MGGMGSLVVGGHECWVCVYQFEKKIVNNLVRTRHRASDLTTFPGPAHRYSVGRTSVEE